MLARLRFIPRRRLSDRQRSGDVDWLDQGRAGVAHRHLAQQCLNFSRASQHPSAGTAIATRSDRVGAGSFPPPLARPPPTRVRLL